MCGHWACEECAVESVEEVDKDEERRVKRFLMRCDAAFGGR